LNPSITKFFWGKKVIISIDEETEYETSNWDKISEVLEEADALDFPRKTHEEILRELRAFRETE
jgi:hypothetical protein